MKTILSIWILILVVIGIGITIFGIYGMFFSPLSELQGSRAFFDNGGVIFWFGGLFVWFIALFTSISLLKRVKENER